MDKIMKRLMVPFFIVLLLSGVLMVPLSVPVAAAEPGSDMIAAYELVYEEPDWASFWQGLNKYTKWDLEWYDGAKWVSVKKDLQIVRDYPEPNRVKLTLIFDASHQGNYRLTFAIDQVVRGYVAKLSQYRYELTYDNCSLVWDWSDAVAIPGLVFTHGFQDGRFWFRLRRDNVPLGAHVEIDPSLIASLTGGASASADHMKRLHPSADAVEASAFSQSFETPAYDSVLDSIEVRIGKYGSPTGNAYVKLYSHAGVYGTSSVPDVLLATSEPYNVSTIGDIDYHTFTFTGANRVTLTASTYYVLVYENPGAGTINDSHYIQNQKVYDTPSPSGNRAKYYDSAWTAMATYDTFYKVFAVVPPAIDDVTPTTTFSTGSYGWVNVTVTELEGVTHLDTVTMYANTTGVAETFTLRWTQATGVFSEVSDPSGIVEMLGSVRENVDAYTDKICFRFRLYGATEGDLDVRMVVTNDDALEDAEDFPALFNFVNYEWNPIADIIDSAFSIFGIFGYMTTIANYVSGFTTYFAESIAGILQLIYQQFLIIRLVFATFIYWFSGLLGVVLDFVQFVRDILDGVSIYYNKLGSWWDYFNWNAWSPIIPLFLFLWWLESINRRADHTSGGEIQVFVNDVNTALNLLSYFLGVFAFVVNTIIDRVYGLIQAMP